MTPAEPTIPADELVEPFVCYSKVGTFSAEHTGQSSWSIYSVNFHGDKALVDWTTDRVHAVRLARMHADMELPS